MHIIRKIFPKGLFIFLVLLLYFSFGCSDNGPSKPEMKEGNRYWKKVSELYQKAKESGDKVPEDMVDWVKEDINKIGTLEYKIVYLNIESKSENDIALVGKLNKLGSDRWECFWIEKENNRLILFFRRPRRSYLKGIPMQQILRFIPQGGS